MGGQLEKWELGDIQNVGTEENETKRGSLREDRAGSQDSCVLG
jgi:hypothetical protein